MTRKRIFKVAMPKKEQELFEILAKFKTKAKSTDHANYLPMPRADFLQLFDISIVAGEIDVALCVGNHVIAYSLNGVAIYANKEDVKKYFNLNSDKDRSFK